jgi:hypothetical protein
MGRNYRNWHFLVIRFGRALDPSDRFGPTDYRPIKQFIMHRFDGQQWVPISKIVEIGAAP